MEGSSWLMKPVMPQLAEGSSSEKICISPVSSKLYPCMKIKTLKELELFLEDNEAGERSAGKDKGIIIIKSGRNKKLHNEIKALAEAKGIVVNILDTAENKYNWKRIASLCVIGFGLMLAGYFLFSYLPIRDVAGNTYKWYQALDKAFLLMLLAGFMAQLVDGALGMGYGVTSATILLSAGVNPAAISGSIHTAEMFASGVSGYSHYKFGNVNKKLFKALLIPGILGAIAGAVVLVTLGNKYGNYIRPVIATYTLVLG